MPQPFAGPLGETRVERGEPFSLCGHCGEDTGVNQFTFTSFLVGFLALLSVDPYRLVDQGPGGKVINLREEAHSSTPFILSTLACLISGWR